MSIEALTFNRSAPLSYKKEERLAYLDLATSRDLSKITSTIHDKGPPKTAPSIHLKKWIAISTLVAAAFLSTAFVFPIIPIIAIVVTAYILAMCILFTWRIPASLKEHHFEIFKHLHESFSKFCKQESSILHLPNNNFHILDYCHKEEALLLISLAPFIKNQEHFTQLFQGAHIRFNDNGALYAQWLTLSPKKRPCSHPTDLKTSTYGIRGPLVKEALFGMKEGHTWIQLEAHPIGWLSPISTFLHLVDYVKYKRSGHNIGPYGRSPHTHHTNRLLAL